MKVQTDCSYHGEARYCLVDVSPVQFEESRNQGYTDWCQQCEAYYSVELRSNGLCYKCRGFEYAPESDIVQWFEPHVLDHCEVCHTPIWHPFQTPAVCGKCTGRN